MKKKSFYGHSLLQKGQFKKARFVCFTLSLPSFSGFYFGVWGWTAEDHIPTLYIWKMLRDRQLQGPTKSHGENKIKNCVLTERNSWAQPATHWPEPKVHIFKFSKFSRYLPESLNSSRTSWKFLKCPSSPSSKCPPRPGKCTWTQALLVTSEPGQYQYIWITTVRITVYMDINSHSNKFT